MRCAMTDRAYPDYTDGVWDEGEWISWDWIDGELRRQELRRHCPNTDPDIVVAFDTIVSAAQQYKEATGRYLQIWGELGELYAQIRYGVKLHKPHTRGSDGTLGNDFVEIKTISPQKAKPRISVKRAGNFSKLILVRIDSQFDFQSLILDRKRAGKGTGKIARVPWPTQFDGDSRASADEIESVRCIDSSLESRRFRNHGMSHSMSRKRSHPRVDRLMFQRA